MLPFENKVVTFEMTGLEVLKMMGTLQSGHLAFYHTAGLMQNVTLTPRNLLDIKLYNGDDIDKNKTYTISTNDFMLGGGDDFKDVVTWYKARNVKTFSLMRDLIINYITNVGVIKRSDYINPDKKRINIVSSPEVSKISVKNLRIE